MGSTERDILDRVKANLEGIDGSGSYDFDLSGADAVQIGMATEPVHVPAAYIFPLRINTTQTGGRTPLRRYDREMAIQIDLYVPATDSTPGNALKAAFDGLDDIMRAIENDRSLGSTGVHDIEVEASAFDGAEYNRPGLGVAVCLLSVRYSEVGGS